MCLVRNIYNIQQSNKIKNKYINKLVFRKIQQNIERSY